MPTTLVGLLIFISLLLPGFVSYVHRRALAPTRAVSSLVELVTLATVSIVTDLATLGLFGLIRLALPHGTPDVGRLLASRTRQAYLIAHFPVIMGWAAAFMAVSSALAYLSSTNRARRYIPGTPVMIEASSWYHLFEARPDKYVYLGCDLRDGTYIAGALEWYNTDVAETENRDLVLSPPLLRAVEGQRSPVDDFERVVVSARDISRMYVTYVDTLEV